MAALNGCGEKKIFPLPEFAPPSIQPVVSCYTEYTTPVPFGARDNKLAFAKGICAVVKYTKLRFRLLNYTFDCVYVC